MGKSPIICACPFCGQVIDPEGNRFRSQKDADNYATVRCECSDAKKAIDKAKILGDARKEIDALFAGESGEDRIEARELLSLIALQILEGKIKSANISLGYQTRATVTRGSKSALSITRTDTQATKREVWS